MKEYTIDVLGTQYTVRIVPTSADDYLKEYDGYCDDTIKEIIVDDGNTWTGFTLKNPSARVKKNIRHEIVHAFLFESGLAEDWEHKGHGQEETTVDWFARMFPKLLEAFRQCDAI